MLLNSKSKLNNYWQKFQPSGSLVFFGNASGYDLIASWIILISLILSFVFILASLYIFIKVKPRDVDDEDPSSVKLEAKPVDVQRIEIWGAIKNKATSANESEWKYAVIEADRYVDDALKSAGYAGESMGERLMMIKPNNLLSLQDLWDAHKLRNLIVHNENFRVSQNQVIDAVNQFEKTLRELGVLN